MITRIYIDNFRCFSNFELKPERINLLFGLNGSGKSSFVDVFDRIVGLVVEGRDVNACFTPDDLTQWDSRLRQRFELALTIDDETFAYQLTLECPSKDGDMELRDERVIRGSDLLFRYEAGDVHLYDNNGREGTHFAFRGDRSFMAGIEERPETTSLMRFLTQLRGLRGYKLEPTRMGSVTQTEHQQMLKDGSNFASWYRHVSQERQGDLSAFFERLKNALPGFQALALKGAGMQGRTRDLVAVMRAEGQDNYEVDFEAISDGQRALIVLYTLLDDIGESPRTVLLDEPENYVGLSELQPWLQLLDDALGDAGQLFLISHHPEVIDFLAAENPIRFERPGGGPVRVTNAGFERESGLKASEQIARGLLDAE